MPSKREHVERNNLLNQVSAELLGRAHELPAARGVKDGRSSFLFLLPDKSGHTIRRVDGRWERISLSSVILINIGSRVHDDIEGGDGTVISIQADEQMRPLLRVRMDEGQERILDADATHGA